MRVAAIDARLLRLPLPARRSLPRADDPGYAEPTELTVLSARLTTADGQDGIGLANVGPSARAAVAIVDEVFAGFIVGSDPCQTARLYAKARQACSAVTSGGVEAVAYAAIDVALWDLKARSAGQPLWQLLGGARDTAAVHLAETAAPGLSADRVVELARSALDGGVGGLLVGVAGRDPVADAQKLQRVRDELGEDAWFGVCGHSGLDLNTALAFGRFLEEELDADLYADPVAGGDLDALRRLAGTLGLPVAAGAALGAEAFAGLVTRGRVAVLRPDLGRVGGITPFLTLAALAEAHHRTVMPIGPPAVLVHLACGLPAVSAIAYDRRMDPLVAGGPALRDGRLVPPNGPGLGCTLGSAVAG
jgi:L-alanine-DL-glutamate epimerase-like enolase superfamily enzyme